MDVLSQLFSTFKVSANVFHNGQYCGNWAVDTSGTQYMSFHIVSFGRCFVTVGDGKQKIVLEQGDIVLFPKDVTHCITNDETFSLEKNLSQSKNFEDGIDAGGTGLICGYFAHNHPLVTAITEHLPQSVFIKRGDSGEQKTALHSLIDALLEESTHPEKGSELILGKIAEALLAIIFRQNLPSNTGVLAASIHPKLGKAIHAIHADAEKKWSVEQLAELCFMSRSAFSELFKSVLSVTPMDYIAQWRLSLAYRMLADEKVSTLQAAMSCGYDNESSFSKAFKRVMGVSPGAVRADKKAVA